MMVNQFVWGHEGLSLGFVWDDDGPVQLAALTLESRQIVLRHRMPIIEVLTAGAGHAPASDRIVRTVLGASLRYRSHSEIIATGMKTLVIKTAAEGIDATIEIELPDATPTFRSRVTVMNAGAETIVLRALTSWSSGFELANLDGTSNLEGWERITGLSDWLGEGRWARQVLRGRDFPELGEHLTGHNPRSAMRAISTGTWSTGKNLPVAAIESVQDELAWAWQIEHNGPWRWEIGEDTPGGYFALSGPTEVDSNWSRVLDPGASFTSVPVAVAVASDFESAIGALTRYRRTMRRSHPDNEAMPVVFNDYMNTLDGDPTTERLLPLVAAAADIGAEIFCIDAGWYDDGGDWWDSVGEWAPSTTRFPGGLGEVIDAINGHGMTPGLWLEPEVVGVRSPLVDALPREAFLLRHGQRIMEHNRYHLDLRHPTVIAHLDGVVDRLVADFGIGFFKFDYNINPGAGTDYDASSIGDGLLEHNRAHLAWLDGLLDRHPSLVIENCSSGAMRADFAILSRLAVQSTSDQQDFTKYPPIAASAPISYLPEQAASWAYPQPEMSLEEVAFCLTTGLLGRFYLSGYLNRMDDERLTLVREAVSVAKDLRHEVRTGLPYWPLGLPAWVDPWIALGMKTATSDLLSVWNRGSHDDVEIHLPHLSGRDIAVEPVFPKELTAWPTTWNPTQGVLTIHHSGSIVSTEPIAARVLRLTPF